MRLYADFAAVEQIDAGGVMWTYMVVKLRPFSGCCLLLFYPFSVFFFGNGPFLYAFFFSFMTFLDEK